MDPFQDLFPDLGHLVFISILLRFFNQLQHATLSQWVRHTQSGHVLRVRRLVPRGHVGMWVVRGTPSATKEKVVVSIGFEVAVLFGSGNNGVDDDTYLFQIAADIIFHGLYLDVFFLDDKGDGMLLASRLLGCLSALMRVGRRTCPPTSRTEREPKRS